MARDEEQTATDGDWAARGAGIVQSMVETIRDRSVRPASFVVRTIIIGVVVALVGVVALVALVVGVVHLLNTDVFNGRVWITDLLIGGIFAAVGVFLFTLSNHSRRNRGTD